LEGGKGNSYKTSHGKTEKKDEGIEKGGSDILLFKELPLQNLLRKKCGVGKKNPQRKKGTQNQTRKKKRTKTTFEKNEVEHKTKISKPVSVVPPGKTKT